jgi:prevent-host-death family protein
MAVTTMSSREFNQDTSRAKNAALEGPVVITDRGVPAHVLLSFAEFKKLSRQKSKIGDLLAMDEYLDVELPLPKASELPRPAQL